MKNLWTCVILAMLLPPVIEKQDKKEKPVSPLPVAGNLFIITTDGFRWQEVFTGADPALINSSKYTPDTSTIKMLYWTENPEERRKKLPPFFWNVIAQKGQVFAKPAVSE